MTDEPSMLPWHLEGKCIYTAHGDFIGEMEHTDDARLVVDAVNLFEIRKHAGSYSKAVLKFIEDRHLAFDPADDWIPLEFVLWLFGIDYDAFRRENKPSGTVRRHCEIYASRHEAYLAYKALKPVPHWFEDDGVPAFMVVDFHEWVWLPPADGNRYTHREHDRFLDGTEGA